ncbi:hypothetical protein [Oceanobacillus neutriphilus]|uniref:Gfo/Idh/MocA-like oxidoreductase C-terminal domain-containing protein n=1 Tax=Oceanobacillus neutriphilus TaxID=531815 RepID=A0ABQ2NTL3_9BACI|nr:hypothetical protein [Oceanobacillus neutriphilus]GGP08528.1 hypothetical protein GCM10011346_08930 [Oceanobacillus neutriphilus]
MSWTANIKEDQTHISISRDKGGLSVFPYEFYQPKYGKMMETHTEIIEDHHQAGILQVKNFIGACLEVLRVTRVIDAIYESSKQGKSIFLSY